MEKVTFVDQIEVVANGALQVRTRTNFVEDGLVIGSSLHRHVVNPGDDYSNEDARVQAICAATHTQEVIDSYKAADAAQEK
jgi:hypothetical protein